jgi:hypothetical protein
MAKNSLPFVPDTRTEAGRLVKLAGRDKNRNQLAEFECRHCGKLKIRRLDKLLSGELKSCGCKRGRDQSAFQKAVVANMSFDRRRRVADSVHRLGHRATQAREGLWKITIDFVVRDVQQWLSQRNDLFVIDALARKNFAKCCAHYRLLRSELVYVCNIARRLKRRAEQWWSNLSDEQREVRTQALAGVEIAKSAGLARIARRTGRLSLEFTQREFHSTGKLKSYFRSAFLAITATVHTALAMRLTLGPEIDDFVRVCHYTLAARSARQQETINKWLQSKQLQQPFDLLERTRDHPPRRRSKYVSPVPDTIPPPSEFAELFAGMPLALLGPSGRS